MLRRAVADWEGLGYEGTYAWITLTVHSSLEAVGLTAAVAGRLARAGIACNMLAGAHHDHLLVPTERADEVLLLLAGLSAA
ncbi:ACT domain-containing protein [Tessaracoccus coleopterorum]|uniref:ACT domain-containing protein n=1 Tax=Tessaracoccus coleopterorum TaxID=2714950 RepID=UPI0018D33319